MVPDVFVPMPPKRKYRVLLEIKSVKKGTPTIVEPERLPGRLGSERKERGQNDSG